MWCRSSLSLFWYGVVGCSLKNCISVEVRYMPWVLVVLVSVDFVSVIGVVGGRLSG